MVAGIMLKLSHELFKIENEFTAEIFKKWTLPPILYQYTNVEGLKGIIESRKWHLTHYQYLNDGKEILYADELIVSILEDYIQRERVKWVIAILEETLGKQYGRPSVLKAFANDMYLASFSENGDLLDQWRAYSSDGAGYSIGIKPNELGMKIPGPVIGHSDAITFVKVEYDKNSQERLIRKAIKNMISFAKRQMKPLNDHERKQLCKDIALHLGSMLLSLTVFFKHPAFRNEEEWRVVIHRFGRHLFPATEPKDFLKDVKFRDWGTTLVPYIEKDFSSATNHDLLPLAEIFLGPKHKSTQAKMSLEMFLQSKGYGDAMPTISVSEIAYQ